MNAATELKPAEKHPLKWRHRHKKLYFYICSGAYALFGGGSGVALAIGLGRNQCGNIWLALGLLTWGGLTGLLVCGVAFLVERFCFSEDAAFKQQSQLPPG